MNGITTAQNPAESSTAEVAGEVYEIGAQPATHTARAGLSELDAGAERRGQMAILRGAQVAPAPLHPEDRGRPLLPSSPVGTAGKLRRTWPQRLLLGFNALLVIACLGAAASLYTFQDKLAAVDTVAIDSATAAPARAWPSPATS